MFENAIPSEYLHPKIIQVMMNITVGHFLKKRYHRANLNHFFFAKVLNCATVHLEVMGACICFFRVFFSRFWFRSKIFQLGEILSAQLASFSRKGNLIFFCFPKAFKSFEYTLNNEM